MQIRSEYDDVAKQYHKSLKELEELKTEHGILKWKYEQLNKENEEVNS